MSVIESIINWTKNNLSDWQSDAVRRLLTQKELTEEDVEDLLLMIKELHGLNDGVNQTIVPKPLKGNEVPRVQDRSTKLILKAINNLCNVNAITDGSNLLLGHKGLSVIYGENGAGKSGYARVLKRACKARDSKEKILSNVFRQGFVGGAEATFKISINDGADEELIWKDEKEVETPLSQITVFDSKSANIIVDGNNEVTYLPYGANVFQDLVNLLNKLKSKLELEKPKPNKLEFKDIDGETEAGKIIAELKHSTKEQIIEDFAVWNDEAQNALDKLCKEVAEAELNDPIKQARNLRNLKERIIKIMEKVDIIEKGLSNEQEEHIRLSIGNLREARRAVEIFTHEDLTKEPLPGVGKNAWQLLYNAAKDYSMQFAYPEKEFPQIENGSRCVLCMQTLSDEAKDRMNRFKGFMENTTKREEDNAKKVLSRLSNTIQGIEIPSLESIKDVLDEISDRDANITLKLKSFIEITEKRKKEMTQAITDESIEEFSPIETSPKQGLILIIEQIEAEALLKEKNADPELLNRIKKQKVELEAKKTFTERKVEIVKHVALLKKLHKYEECIKELNTTAITRQGNRIVSAGLTPRFSKALTKETERLGAKHLALQLKSSGSGGQTRYQIQLEEKQVERRAKLSEILSEGEQRVVALTGFFAELDLGEHKCPIVLDDPVTSLDHRYREKIAERLVSESTKRQVIVFTHDIAFLLALEAKAGESKEEVYFHVQTVRNTGDAAGKLTDSKPWHAMKVTDREKYLNEKLQYLRKLSQSEDESYNRKAGEFYALLRETWESLIERDLLNETVFRFSEAVQTQRLKAVEVTTEDYKIIDSGMSKCSTWMFGHDKSAPLDANRPDFEEIEADLKKLKDFGKMIRRRRDDIQKERNAALRPQVPAIG